MPVRIYKYSVITCDVLPGRSVVPVGINRSGMVFAANQAEIINSLPDMRNSLFIGLLFLAGLTSCEKYGRDVIFVINNLEFTADDISLYDSSAHILYLKKSHGGLRDIEDGTFAFYDRGEPVLSGIVWPAYLSSSPSTPVIMSCPFMLQSYALKIETWGNPAPSLINNARLTRLLNRNGLLRSGLAVTAEAPVISGSELTFALTVTNMDETALLIIDPGKTGPGLFRYFTNGLYLYDPVNNSEVFADNIPHVAPDPWNSWSTEWLTKLEPGEATTFTFSYTLSAIPAPGQYKVIFGYPGLSHQVSEGDLYQGTSRIWLGNVLFSRLMTVQ